MIDEPTPQAPADSAPAPTPEPHSWIDQPFMLIFAIIGLCLCKTPKARRNALIITIASGVLFVVYIIIGALNVLNQASP
jgi:hypothetical protein